MNDKKRADKIRIKKHKKKEFLNRKKKLQELEEQERINKFLSCRPNR